MQLTTIIKYFTIEICAFYSLGRLFGEKTALKKRILCLIYSAAITAPVCLTRLYAPPLSIIVMAASLAVFAAVSRKTDPFGIITTSIISLGISYAAFTVSLTAVGALLYFAAPLDRNGATIELLTYLLGAAVQCAAILLIFSFKRFKNGVPFITKHRGSDAALYISMSILLTASMLGISSEFNVIFLIAMFFIFICCLTLVFWWRSRATRVYLEKLRARETDELNTVILEKQRYVDALKEQNDELAKIIHRDNKLIPAMEMAVREYLQCRENGGDLAAKGEELIKNLENMAAQRKGIVYNCENKNKPIPPCGAVSVDSLFKYMQSRCLENKIDFNVSVDCSVKYMVENIVPEEDLNTLLADMTENALIAVKPCGVRNILAGIYITDGAYVVSVADSGIPFEAHTLASLGIKQTTTHADDGGSGIGMMTAFEIMRRCRASIFIEEMPDSVIFTKRVSVRFDGLAQYCIRSPRAADIAAERERGDIKIID